MKTRNGWVSNSSSSSFVLATEKSEKEPKIVLKVKVSELDAVRIDSEEDVLNYVLDEYGYDNLEDFKERAWEEEVEEYEELLHLVKTGKTLWVGSVGSEDYNPISSVLYEHGIPKSDKYEILKGGY